jgi:uncharacterized protein
VSAPHFLEAALRQPESHGLRIEHGERLFVRALELAGESAARRKGLLGRDSLDTRVAFVIAPTQGIHTFGMRFPIDVIAVSRDGRVVKVREAVGPNRLVFAWTAFAMLETAAGVARAAGLAVGDRLCVVENGTSAGTADAVHVTR